MKHIKQGIVAAVSAGAALATGQAAAEAYYLGGSIGQSNLEVSEQYDYYFNSESADSGEVEFEADDTAFKIFGGYMFNEYVGIEAGYLDLGDLEDSASIPYYGFDGGESGETEMKAQITGWTVQVVGQYPIGPVDVFAKAGFIDYDLMVEESFRACDSCAKQYDDWTDEGNDWIYGVGASWNVGDFGIRAEWENIEQKHSSVDDLSVISIGFEYHLMR